MIKEIVSKTIKDSNAVVISKNEYDKLIEDQKLLRALQTAGVDNWEWYETALDSLREVS